MAGSLWPHQKEALEALRTARHTKAMRGLVVMPCGAGKTRTAEADVECFASEVFCQDRSKLRVLFLCHNSNILLDAKGDFEKYFGNEYTYATYISTVGGVMRGTRPPAVNFLFASFQTLLGRCELFQRAEFDYIIVNEAHHVRADTYERIVRYFWPKFLLGLTATDYRMDKKMLEPIFGSALYHMDLIDGILAGVLSPFKYYLMVDTVDADDVSIVNFMNGELDQARRRGEKPSLVMYCRTVKHARRVAKLYGDKAKVVVGEMSPQESKEVINQLRTGEIEAVCSVQKLNEGIDVPAISHIAFLKNTVSKNVLVQQLGRGARKAPGKTCTYVYDFIAGSKRVDMVKSFANTLKARMLEEKRKGYKGQYQKLPFELVERHTELKKTEIDIHGALEELKPKATWDEDSSVGDMLKAYVRESLACRHWLGWVAIDKHEGLPPAKLYKKKIGNRLSKLTMFAKRSLSYDDQRLMMDYYEETVMLDIQRLTLRKMRLPTEKEIDAEIYYAGFKACDELFGGGGLERIIRVCELRELLRSHGVQLEEDVEFLPEERKTDIMRGLIYDLADRLTHMVSSTDYKELNPILSAMKKVLDEIDE